MDLKPIRPPNLKVEVLPLAKPDLNEIVEVISAELPKNFKHVEARISSCPDLTGHPFNLASEGLAGSECVVDIGGPSYLLPLVQREKIYDFKDLPNLISADLPCFILGAGAGPWPYIGSNCEMAANLVIREDSVVNNQSRIGVVSSDGMNHSLLRKVPDSETSICLLGNFYCSSGKPGQVISVHCKGRTGEHDFITSIRLALSKKFGDQPIGLGGVFLIAEGKAKHHVMPDFSKTPLNSDEDLQNWLKYYEFSAPIVELGTLVSYDPGLNLRVQHFHGFGNNVAGHYHYDTTPDSIEYVGYFSVASKLYRIDKPEEFTPFGAD